MSSTKKQRGGCVPCIMDAWHTYADRHAYASVHSRTLSHEVAKYEH